MDRREPSRGLNERTPVSYEQILFATLLLLLAAPAPLAAQTDLSEPERVERVERVPGPFILLGFVVDAESREPIRTATVALEGTRIGTTTDDRGRFRISPPAPGLQVLQVRHIGFAPARVAVEAREGETTVVSIAVRVRPVPIAELRVRARSPLEPLPGFERRRSRGVGHLMTRADIEAQRPVRTTDIFNSVPGVVVVRSYLGPVLRMRGAAPVFHRGTVYECQVQYLIDGAPAYAAHPSEPVMIDQIVRPIDIEALEIYRSSSEVPAEFRRAGSDCGVVVIWTRDRLPRSVPP
jgi:hypothetical protein